MDNNCIILAKVDYCTQYNEFMMAFYVNFIILKVNK